MIVDVLYILAGLALLYFGGEGLIKGAVSLARTFGLSKLLVSAVIVGFGTSMPEMTVSLGAAFKGSPDIALGNVVGSNIANVLLIVGVGAVITPIFVSGAAVRRDAYVMLGASVALCALSFLGAIPFLAGLGMLCCLSLYIYRSYSQDRKAQAAVANGAIPMAEGDGEEDVLSPGKAAGYSLAGLILLVIGASLMVEGAISLARDAGISEAVIGLTIVAVGTSLPELATAVIAALKRHSEVIIGNILGSNIFNILSILGVTAMVSPIRFTGQIASVDVWIMLMVAVALSVFLVLGKPVTRLAGAVMLTSYAGYTFWLYTLAGS